MRGKTMEIKKCNLKTKCDIGGCKNMAIFSICNNQETKPVLNICEKCSKDIYNTLGKINTPKSIPAPFKNQKKVKLEAK